MSLSVYQRDYAYCLGEAARLLGQPVRPLIVPMEAEFRLRKRLKREAVAGLGTPHALLRVTVGRDHTDVSVGIETFQLVLPARTIRLAHVILPYGRSGYAMPDFWAAAEDDHALVRRYVRRLQRRNARTPMPVMNDQQRERLWQNTIGFLLSDRALFRRYGIAKKRGILLSGAPGNGKTMACRWLFAECQRLGLYWRNVTMADYREANENGCVSRLFHLDRPGIVLFDDMDFGLRDRNSVGSNSDHATFLGELDGVSNRRGVVYLFTSNARLTDLDPAFRRPGRIDVVMEFSRPDGALRARYIRERWQADIREAVDEDAVVTATDGLCFADLEELRKLLVLQYLEDGEWDWARAWRTFQEGRGNANAGRIGFGAAAREKPAREERRERETSFEPVTASRAADTRRRRASAGAARVSGTQQA